MYKPVSTTAVVHLNASRPPPIVKNFRTRNEIPDFDYRHPEKTFAGLELISQNLLPNWPEKTLELCWSCGWNSYNQQISSYVSRVRIFYTSHAKGYWAIGTEWLLRDEPNDKLLGNDYITQKFLHKQPGLTIPLLEEYRSLSKPGDPVYFTLMPRAKGVTLQSIWDRISEDERASYVRQLADAMRQWRQFTAPGPQKVDGSPLPDNMIARCEWVSQRNGCFNIGSSKDDWLDKFTDELRDGITRIYDLYEPAAIEEKLQRFREGFPACEPWVLTHADLDLSNIMVKDGKIEAIIDWESSGYYPWWYERFMGCLFGNQILHPVWEHVMPEMDQKTFIDKVYYPVVFVRNAFKKANCDHPGVDLGWMTPPFCECQPWQGTFRFKHIDHLPQHKLVKIPPEVLLDEKLAEQKLLLSEEYRRWVTPKMRIEAQEFEENLLAQKARIVKAREAESHSNLRTDPKPTDNEAIQDGEQHDGEQHDGEQHDGGQHDGGQAGDN